MKYYMCFLNTQEKGINVRIVFFFKGNHPWKNGGLSGMLNTAEEGASLSLCFG